MFWPLLLSGPHLKHPDAILAVKFLAPAEGWLHISSFLSSLVPLKVFFFSCPLRESITLFKIHMQIFDISVKPLFDCIYCEKRYTNQTELNRM